MILIKAQTAVGLELLADPAVREHPDGNQMISQEMAYSVDTSRRLHSLTSAIIVTK